MAGQDNTIFNNLERALSTDINELQQLKDRSLLDMLRRAMSTISHPSAFGSVPTSALRATVLGGLEIVPNGNDVSVQPGALLQDSSTLAPVPGALDSDYRIGINRTAETVTMPVPGAESWVLIEANMVNVVTLNVARDIFNPGTGLFVPTPVDKRAERQLDFTTVTVVATVPAFTGGNSIPIAIVRRPIGGGPVAATDIYDLRPMWQNRLPRAGVDLGVTTAFSAARRGKVAMWVNAIDGVASDLVTIQHAEAFARNGERLFIQADDLDITAADIAESGFASAGSTWFYVYLAPFRGVVPANAYQARAQSNGLLVLSAVGPNANGTNSAAITPGAPWNTAPAIAAGDAILLFPIRRNAGDTSWDHMSTADGHLFKGQLVNISTLAPPVAGVQTVAPGTSSPDGTRSLLISFFWNGAGPASSENLLNYRPVGVGTVALSSTSHVDDATAAVNNAHVVEIPVEALGSKSFDLDVTGGAINAGSTLTIAHFGWRM